jgi:hypothetical protein
MVTIDDNWPSLSSLWTTAPATHCGSAPRSKPSARSSTSPGRARASFPALDREWLETEDGRWIRRSAIVELALSNGQA